MRTIAAILFLMLTSFPALAWNAAGHRLVAVVAWRQMSPAAQKAVRELLQFHADYPKWSAKATEQPGYIAFVESSTWADEIRNDPRFFDEQKDPPAPIFSGMPDTARHKAWHYVDRRPDGSRSGELDRQLQRLIDRLGEPTIPPIEIAYALPWLIHLVGDIHQPLHVGSRDDEGGNGLEIENPFNPRLPFTNLHTWWDDLPGPPWLRGARLEKAADALLASYPNPPQQGNVAQWEQESREISTDLAYPRAFGSLLPIITEEFRNNSRTIANRRLAQAGYRLGGLLETIFGGTAKVPRETK